MATTRPGKRIPGPPSIPGACGEIAGRGDYLSRDAVLEHLHIKPQTFYSYVSRGFIRSVPQPDGRSSFYLREDVEPVAAGLARVFGIASGALHLNAINAALVAVADHELNPATFAARVAASGSADMHSCIGAALDTHYGTLVGRTCDWAEELFEPPADPELVFERAMAMRAASRSLPGFCNRLRVQCQSVSRRRVASPRAPACCAESGSSSIGEWVSATNARSTPRPIANRVPVGASGPSIFITMEFHITIQVTPSTATRASDIQLSTSSVARAHGRSLRNWTPAAIAAIANT